MTLEADTFLQFAQESIEANGASVTLRKAGTETYDPATGDLTGSPTDYATKGLIENYSDFFIAQGIVQSGDRKVTIAAASLTVSPEQGDTLLIGTESFDVVEVKREYAGDTAVIHILQIRKPAST